MDYLILNGMHENDSFLQEINNRISGDLHNQDLQGESILLHEKTIKPCLGCFKCWVQTPGICIIDDYGREVAKKMIQTDNLLYLTSIQFGGYSSELKKALDRSIGLLMPFFRVFHEEIHHETRYDKYPNMTVFGTLDQPNEQQELIFTKLVQRNSLNNFAPEFTSQIIYTSDDEPTIKSKIERGLSVLGDVND